MKKVFIISKNENTYEHKACVAYAEEHSLEIAVTEFVNSEQEKDEAICKIVDNAMCEKINTVLFFDVSYVSRSPEQMIVRIEKMLDNSVTVLTVVGGEILTEEQNCRNGGSVPPIFCFL